MTDHGFLQTILGHTGMKVFRLGLSATYWPGKKTIYHAIDEGVNYLFAFGIDRQMLAVIRDVVAKRREQFVIATGAYNLLFGYPDIRRTFERRLRQLKTDYIDVFHFLGVTKEQEFPEKARQEMVRLRDEGKVRAIAMSCHDRKFAGKLAAEGALDVLMIRYNAAHRGAEKDIFPHLVAHNPGIVAYTATKWTELIRRPKGYPADKPIVTPGLAYRFVLSNPHVHVCLSAPTNIKQINENLLEIRKGPLSTEEMEFVKEFGDIVYNKKRWFM